MIINGHGQLVWFDQVAPPNAAANFRPQTFLGHKVLTWWQGRVTVAAYGLGEGVIADTRYNTRTVVKAGNGYQADIHEFALTPSGDAMITAYQLVMTHLPGTPAAKLSPLLDSIVQEVDVRTGLVTWEWHSLGHIAIADSDVTAATSAYFDAFHLNSIELLPNGHVLVSARDTSSIYNIDQDHRSDRVDAGRQGEQLPDGPGCELLLPARRADAARQPREPVRRRGWAADPGAALEGSRPGAQHAPSHRGGLRAVHAGRHPGQQPGELPDAAEPRRPRRLRGGAELHRVLAERADRVRRPPADRRRHLPGLPVPVVGHADDAARARRQADLARARSRSRRAGTAPRPSPAGGCWARSAAAP